MVTDPRNVMGTFTLDVRAKLGGCARQVVGK
jgi:hypothetical protein